MPLLDAAIQGSPLKTLALSLVSKELRELLTELQSLPIQFDEVSMMLVKEQFQPCIADIVLIKAVCSNQKAALCLIERLDISLTLGDSRATRGKFERILSYLNQNQKGIGEN